MRAQALSAARRRSWAAHSAISAPGALPDHRAPAHRRRAKGEGRSLCRLACGIPCSLKEAGGGFSAPTHAAPTSRLMPGLAGGPAPHDPCVMLEIPTSCSTSQSPVGCWDRQVSTQAGRTSQVKDGRRSDSDSAPTDPTGPEGCWELRTQRDVGSPCPELVAGSKGEPLVAVRVRKETRSSPFDGLRLNGGVLRLPSPWRPWGAG